MLATLDKPLVAVVILLLAIGSLMVFSSTWDWSNKTYGSATGFFVEEHLRNVVLAALALIFFATIDYRFWKRFAFWLLLLTIVLLIAVRVIRRGEIRRPAIIHRRALSAGRVGGIRHCAVYGGLAGFAKNTRVDSFIFGLVPFLIVVGALSGLDCIAAGPEFGRNRCA